MKQPYIVIYHGEGIEPVVVTTKDRIHSHIMQHISTWCCGGDDIRLHEEVAEDTIIVRVEIDGHIGDNDSFSYEKIELDLG